MVLPPYTLLRKSTKGRSRFSPTYRHLFDHFHAFLRTTFMLIHQQFELQGILCAVPMWLQPNTMVWQISRAGLGQDGHGHALGLDKGHERGG